MIIGPYGGKPFASQRWIPAFAGMTLGAAGMTLGAAGMTLGAAGMTLGALPRRGE